MSKPKKKNTPEIYVSLVFDGKGDSRQIFIGLMLDKVKSGIGNDYNDIKSTNGISGYTPDNKPGLEHTTHARYNRDKVFSDVRVG